MGVALNIASAVFGIAAAVLWFRSARVRVPKTYLTVSEAVQPGFDGSIGIRSQTFGLEELATAVKEQSRLSGQAAICATAAASLTAISALLAALL